MCRKTPQVAVLRKPPSVKAISIDFTNLVFYFKFYKQCLYGHMHALLATALGHLYQGPYLSLYFKIHSANSLKRCYTRYCWRWSYRHRLGCGHDEF